MSWFDTSQLASMASKAMKEAQKTFDKALDIDEGDEEAVQNDDTVRTPTTTNTTDESSWSSSWNKFITPPHNTATESSDQDTSAKSQDQQISDSSKKRKKNSIWNSLSGAASLISSPEEEKSPQDQVPGADGVQTVHVTQEPVSSQPVNSVNIHTSQPAASSVNQGDESQNSEDLASHSSSPSDDNIDKELLRDSVEDGFSTAKLIVTAFSSEDHHHKSHQLAGKQDLLESVNLDDDNTCDLTNFSNSVIGSISASDNEHLSSQQSAEISPLSTSINQHSESGSDHHIISESGSDHQIISESGSDHQIVSESGSEESGSESPAGCVLETGGGAHVQGSSSSSVDVITPSSIEPISCSSIDVISSPEGGAGTGTPLTPRLAQTRGATTCDVMTIHESGLNVSGSSDTTLVVRLEDDEVESVETMLCDALREQDKKSGEGSMSSQSSDIVKIDCVSETSTDELENQNSAAGSSSDVEVISSSKDDRLSVASSTESNQQIIELRHENNELKELLKARETKILQLSREMTSSHEGREMVTSKLESALKKIDQFREEIEAKSIIIDRLQNDLKVEKSDRITYENKVKKLESEVGCKKSSDEKKDSLITDLRNEGEALARQNGKQADTIRKLRAKEKTLESERNLLTEESERLKKENEKLTKTVGEKSENETSISKSVKSLAEGNKTLETEKKNLTNELEESKEKVKGLRSSLEAAYKDISHLKQQVKEAQSAASSQAAQNESRLRQRLEDNLAEAEDGREADRMEYEARINSCQEALVTCQRSANAREEQLMRELEEARNHAEMTDKRYEDLNLGIEAATRPLLKQIQSLQQELSKLRQSSHETESHLADRIKTLSANLNIAKDKERKALDQYENLTGKFATLEATVNTTSGNRSELESRIKVLDSMLEKSSQQVKSEEENNKNLQQHYQQQIHKLRKDKEVLELKLENVTSESEARRRACEDLAQQNKDQEERLRDLQADAEVRGSSLRPNSTSNYSSPSPSFSHMVALQLNDNMAKDNNWADELLSPSATTNTAGIGGNGGGFLAASSNLPSLYDTVKHGNSAAYLENMESQLKMKDGEVAGLLQQVQQLDRLKGSLATQLGEAVASLEQKDGQLKEMADLEEQLATCKEKYSQLEKVLREKEEEVSDMKQDLAYVKEKYKTQIDQLMSSQS